MDITFVAKLFVLKTQAKTQVAEQAGNPEGNLEMGRVK